jgi:hypothetical protein
MFGTTQPDTLCPKGDGMADLIWLICVGANLHGASLISPLHELGKEAIDGALGWGEIFIDQDADNIGRGGLDLARENFSCGAIDRKKVAFSEILTSDVESIGGVVDLEL